MSSQDLAVVMDLDQVEQLEARLRAQLNGRVCDFRLDLRDAGLVLQGRTRCYYAKQLAQHAVMQATDLPVLANDIEVI